MNSIRACENEAVGRHHFERIPPSYAGMMIAICGTDAAGKATQTKLLAEAIGGEVVSFPDYTTAIGKLILAHLKDQWQATEVKYGAHVKADHDALVLQSLFTVNRLELLPRIAALRAAGKPVVLDRYWLSGVVYGTLDGLDQDWLWEIHESLPAPDAWVLIDVDPEESVRRRPERRDRYEKQAGLMAKARAEYLSIFESRKMSWLTGLTAGPQWHIVDGHGTIEEVHARLLGIVQALASSPTVR